MAVAVGSDIDSFIREQKAKLASERKVLNVSTCWKCWFFFCVQSFVSALTILLSKFTMILFDVHAQLLFSLSGTCLSSLLSLNSEHFCCCASVWLNWFCNNCHGTVLLEFYGKSRKYSISWYSLGGNQFT